MPNDSIRGVATPSIHKYSVCREMPSCRATSLTERGPLASTCLRSGFFSSHFASNVGRAIWLILLRRRLSAWRRPSTSPPLALGRVSSLLAQVQKRRRRHRREDSHHSRRSMEMSTTLAQVFLLVDDRRPLRRFLCRSSPRSFLPPTSWPVVRDASPLPPSSRSALTGSRLAAGRMFHARRNRGHPIRSCGRPRDLPRTA